MLEAKRWHIILKLTGSNVRWVKVKSSQIFFMKIRSGYINDGWLIIYA